MSNSNVYLRRRLTAVGALVLVALLVFLGSQLFAAGNNQAEPAVVETTEAEQMNQEIANCQPGVVEVEAFIGRGPMHEALTNIPEGEPVSLWYEITNTGFVDCIFDVGTYATFFTISSGEQIFYTSRDCDRSQDSKLPTTLKANVGVKSEANQWLKVSSSSEFQCTDANNSVPRGGAAYDIRVEVSGVISEKKRFYLF
jgi:hypothetical protein